MNEPTFIITWRDENDEQQEAVRLMIDGSFWANWGIIEKACRATPLSTELGPIPNVLHLLLAIRDGKNMRMN